MSKGFGATPGWVHRDPDKDELDKIVQYISTETGFLENVLMEEKMNNLSGSGVWEWDLHQLLYFDQPSWFICNKCRQSGGSAMLAAKAVARGILAEGNFNCVMTSYKKEEAINKIDYVRSYLEALPPRFRKEIVRDPLQLIEFKNANGTRTKILSHAQKPIRGIPAHMIGLDELAFYQWATAVYASALPAVAMVNGTIDVISTPFGKSGEFFEIFTDKDKFPEYYRMPIMWWMVRRYLKDENLDTFTKALKVAPSMSTEERVEIFGSKSLKRQFYNAADLETFQQEFEGYFVDAQAAFFTKDLILSCMFPEETDINNYQAKEEDFQYMSNGELVQYPVEKALEDERFPLLNKWEGREPINGKVHFKKYDKLEQLYAAVRSGEISRNLVAGVDIGTTRHSSHIIVLEELQFYDGSTLQIERFSLNKSNWDLDLQEVFLANMLKSGFIRKMYADCTGIGTQLGQSLSKMFGGQFHPINFGGNNKLQEALMVNMKNRMESLGLGLLYDKRTIEDIYSIERLVNQSRSISFRADEKKRHHADAAWAIAMASYAGTHFGEPILEMTSHNNKITTKQKDPVKRIADAANKKAAKLGGGLSFRERGAFNKMTKLGGFINNYEG